MQLNIKLDEIENNKVVKLDREGAEKLGFDGKYTWNNLDGPWKDVKIEGGRLEEDWF